MGFDECIKAISTVGFPIFGCIALYIQNTKLTETIAQLKETIVENTAILKSIGQRLDKRED